MSTYGGEVSLRCPACGAALHPDASWCSLCYHDLRRAVEPEPVPAADLDPLTAPLIDVVLPATPVVAPPPPPVAPVVPDTARDTSLQASTPLDAPLPPAGAPELSWPCERCGTRNAISAAACAGCGTAFLAAAAQRKPFVLPIVGDVHALTRAQRLVLAVSVMLAVVVPLAVLTFLLTPEPPPQDDTPPPTGVVQTSP